MPSLPTLTPPDAPASLRCNSLPDVIRWRAELHGDAPAFTWLPDGQREAARLDYAELDRRARAVAALLQAHSVRDRAVILLFQPGPDFVVAFLACLYAGAMGVPLYPPDLMRLNRTLPRFLAIVEDCDAPVILTTREMRVMSGALFEFAPRLQQRTWLTVEDGLEAGPEGFRDPSVGLDGVAFLQYTSGSTGDPKGVMVSHRGLLLNLHLLARGFGAVPGEPSLTWLPNYHDMGLIDGLLRPLFLGGDCVVMPPVAFLKRPLSWLEAISRYRAGVSGGPNFAYELCNAKVSDEQLATLDLSCWHCAYCGAEPVRAATVRRFTERFAAAGFPREAFSPGYGLAEAVLYVCNTDTSRPAVMRPIRTSALEQHRVEPAEPDGPDSQWAVSVGRPEIDVRIVDPETRLLCPVGRVGEIWASGASLALGYLNRPEATAEVFEATLADTGAGPFLRTGDLGFLDEDGELYIGARRKDLIIIRGRNLYPQDVEKTAEESNAAAFRPGCNAAFAVDVDGEERLVIVQEVQRRVHDEQTEWKNRRLPHPGVEAFAPVLHEPPRLDDVTGALRGAIAAAHGVDPYAVVLVKAGTIPKTSSGKIQRRACRDAFGKGGLDVVGSWRSDEAPAAPGPARTPEAPQQPTEGSTDTEPLRRWLREALAAHLRCPMDRVDDQRPFAEQGLDSKEAIVLAGELEEHLGVTLQPSIIYDHPTVERLVAFLAASAPAAPAAPAAGAAPAAAREPIAIVGLGCRFPGAEGAAAFWELLREGRDAVTEVPPGRWSADALTDPDPAAPGKLVSRFGGFVEGIEDFDAAAFDLTTREAARMDPQQRMLLEVATEALESAGLAPADVAGSRTGVFVGVASFDFGRRLLADREAIDAYGGTGVALSIAANRLSYHLDLRGPSVAVDTACSSSLVAIHQAIEALRRGACDRAIAGGVNLILSPDIGIVFSKAGILSADGRCKTFDASADGIARSEGAGAVVLEPLSRALAAGHPVWAVLHGGAVNSDGRSNGLMAPSGAAQEAAIRDALADAGVDAGAVQYVEAHGTGTNLGDPIEVHALAAALGTAGRSEALRVGSVKSNLGHLEAGAGIASVIKLALCLRHRELVPSLHFATPNPRIPFEALGVAVQTRHEPWPGSPGRAVAGVSGFGFGGTNAHLVLGEAPPEAVRPEPADGSPRLVVLSARSEAGLRRRAAELRRALRAPDPATSLPGLAATAAARPLGPWRLAVVARDEAALAERLEAFVDGRPDPLVMAGEGAADVVFVFPGQGGQWLGMGRALYAAEPAFRAFVDRVDAGVRTVAGWSVVEELHAEAAASRLDRTEVTQPVLFAVQGGLCELLRARGVEPAAVVGHSMGEVTAAWAAGRLDLDDAVRVIVHRGRVMANAAPGRMVAVELTLEEAEALVAGHPGVAVAVNNAPSSCVLSGEPAAMGGVIDELGRRELFCRELRVELASHGPSMDALMAPLADAIGALPMRAARVPLVSTVTGGLADGLALDGAYWARNLREPVRFREALEALLADGRRLFLELSPHPVLTHPIGQTAEHAGVVAHAVPTLRRGADEAEAVLAAAGALVCHGAEPTAWVPAAARAVPLVPTPWDRQRCWMDVAETARRVEHPLLGDLTDSPTEPGVRDAQVALDLARVPWVGDHRVQELAVMPATGYLELARAVCRQAAPGAEPRLHGVRFQRVLVLGEQPRLVHTRIEPAGDAGGAASAHGELRFRVFSRPADDAGAPWTLHVEGGATLDGAAEVGPFDLEDARARCVEPISAEAHYAGYRARAIDYRGGFQSVRAVWRGAGEALGRVELDADAQDRRFDVHPALLDACLQVVAATLPAGEHTYMPVEVESVVLGRAPTGATFSHARLRGESGETYTADVTLTDAAGRTWGAVRGLTVKRVERAAVAQGRLDDWMYRVEWEPVGGGGAADGEPGAWLVVAGADAQAEATVRGLQAAGRQVILAGPPGALPFDPRDPASAEQLLDGCPPLAGVVTLAGLDLPDGDDLDAATLGEAVLSACAGTLHLAQGLARRGGPRLWVVTRRAESLPGDGAPAVAQAPLWGMGRSLAHEVAAQWGGLIDLDDATPAAALVAELLSPGADDQIALRDGRRFAPRLVRRAPAAGAPFTCGEGTWLVTGGLGALGLELARWLAGRGARTLLLTGRTGYGPRETWADRAADDPRARALLGLVDAGVDVRVAAVDTTDEAAMRAALADPTLPPLRGVIHAAGVVRPTPALEATVDDLAAELAPKVAGAWVLHRLAPQVDAFVAFSSGAAIWGSKLLAGYGAANHFLDALAHRRAAAGLAALSIDWAMWGDVGMAAEGEHDRMLRRMGLRPMPVDDALAALGALLEGGATQAAVADNDWSVLKPAFEQEPRRRLLARIAAPQAVAKTDAPSLLGDLGALGPDEARAALLGFVREQVAAVLGLAPDAVDPTRALPALGLDSLSANDLRARLQRALPVTVNVLSLLKGDSTEGLTDTLLRGLSLGEAEPAPAAAAAGTPDPGAERLAPDIHPDGALPWEGGPPREILLTGATGYLGAFVLADLLTRTDARVHCLVKAADDGAALARLRARLQDAGLWQDAHADRIVPVVGDLALPHLGLSPSRWAALAARVDHVLHAGFVVNFLFSYEDLRAANVAGTAEILRLACTTRVKPVHFVSSFSVLLTPEYTGRPVGEHDPLYPGEGGYRQGKRASEGLCEQARDRGLPVVISRPPFIGWSRSTGHYNDRDFLIRLIQGCLRLGAAPEMDILFYLNPVDAVAASVVSLSLDPRAHGRNVNLLTGPTGHTWGELVSLFNAAGAALERLPFAAWRARLAADGPDNPLHVFFPLVREGLDERGSAVIDLFHRRGAPSSIGLDNALALLGPAAPDTALTPALAAPFVARLRREQEA